MILSIPRKNSIKIIIEA